jgi:hypothetical protein
MSKLRLSATNIINTFQRHRRSHIAHSTHIALVMKRELIVGISLIKEAYRTCRMQDRVEQPRFPAKAVISIPPYKPADLTR